MLSLDKELKINNTGSMSDEKEIPRLQDDIDFHESTLPKINEMGDKQFQSENETEYNPIGSRILSGSDHNNRMSPDILHI